DNVLKYKYIIKNVARKHGKTATFMPKPLFMDNGTGMHVHSSLWKDGKNLYAGSGYAGLSDMAMYAIGGLLKQSPPPFALPTSPPRPQTPRGGGCQPARRGSPCPTPAATGRRRSAYPCIRRAPRPSGWSSAARTAPPILTWPSPPCSWPCSTASSTR